MRQTWDEGKGGVSPLSFLLQALSLPYLSAVKIRNSLYDRKILPAAKLPCPVVSIGNITVGGTGKTPFAIMLARQLKARGFSTAILTRGYGGSVKETAVLLGDEGEDSEKYRLIGDEAVLMARKLADIPVFVGAKRELTGRLACECHRAGLLILDDGFQHRALHRDLDIVLLDREKPFGNHRLLPRGPLREAVSSLIRADALVFTGSPGAGPTETAATFPALPPVLQAIPTFQAVRRPLELIRLKDREAFPPAILKGRRVALFSGIGSPENFSRTVYELGAQVSSFLAYGDHHRYGEREVREINELFARGESDFLVTTEKDAVKLGDSAVRLPETYVLKIEMELAEDLERFLGFCLSRLAGWKTGQGRRQPG